MNPAFLTTLASLVCAVFGISDPGMQDIVKAVIAGAAGVVVAVYTWQHHKTTRNADTLAAQLQAKKIEATTPPPAPPATVPVAAPSVVGVPESIPPVVTPMPTTIPAAMPTVAGHQVFLGGTPQG